MRWLRAARPRSQGCACRVVLGAGPHLLNRRMEYDGSFQGGDPDFPDAWIRQDYGDVPASALRIELRLVGGETIADGHLRFRPGHVLSAIHGNEWLVLDEANRADMDKIFGGLLTWLSGQKVELGRASTGLDAPTVVLEWARDEEDSRVEGWNRLEDASGSDPLPCWDGLALVGNVQRPRRSTRVSIWAGSRPSFRSRSRSANGSAGFR